MIARCIGIVVGTPVTWNAESAAIIRSIASVRSLPLTISLASSES